MPKNTRRRLAREEGQAIVTLALMSTFLLAILGIGIDSGIIWMQRRSLQTVADAAVLAGVQAFQCNGGGAAAAEAAAVDWAGRNDPDAAVVATANGAQKSLHVHVEKPAETMLLGMFDIVDPDVPAEASAALDCTATGLFAIDNSCSGAKGIDFSGFLVAIQGSTHSNSEVRVNGFLNIFTGGSNTHRCGGSGFSGGSFNLFSPPMREGPALPTPLDRAVYDAELATGLAFAMNLGSCPPGGIQTAGNLTISSSRPPGRIECATGNITVTAQTLNSNPAGGTVTLIAGGNITVSGNTSTTRNKTLRNVKLIAKGQIAISGESHNLDDVKFIADTSIAISGTGHDLDSVTLRANGRVSIIGVDIDLTSPDIVSIYSASSASDPGAIEVSGFASGVTNCMFAPVGEIDIFGVFSAVVGCLVGWRIDIDAGLSANFEIDPSTNTGGWVTQVRTYRLTQ